MILPYFVEFLSSSYQESSVATNRVFSEYLGYMPFLPESLTLKIPGLFAVLSDVSASRIFWISEAETVFVLMVIGAFKTGIERITVISLPAKEVNGSSAPTVTR